MHLVVKVIPILFVKDIILRYNKKANEAVVESADTLL